MLIRNQDVVFSSPAVMGILNVTPDSFSDGGKHNTLDKAYAEAMKMVEAGAEFIDIGGESTRPGAPEVSEEDELARVVPIIEKIRANSDVYISIDTSKAKVMEHAVNAGADLINDVRALQEPGALAIAAQLQVPVCLMHMQGQPRTMQMDPSYRNVVDDVNAFLLNRVQACVDAGIAKNAIMLDPGFGFGKSVTHNYELLANLESCMALGFPVLVGMSRKSMIGNLLNRSVDRRLAGSIAVATIAAQKGAHVIRVHDVEETMDAVRIVNMLKQVS